MSIWEYISLFPKKYTKMKWDNDELLVIFSFTYYKTQVSLTVQPMYVYSEAIPTVFNGTYFQVDMHRIAV